MTKRPDQFDRMAERLQGRIRVWVQEGLPFDDVIAAALRAAYKRGYAQAVTDTNRERADDAFERELLKP